MTEKNGQGLETPSVFKAPNYHGIEYLRNVDRSLYMKTCGVQRSAGFLQNFPEKIRAEPGTIQKEASR